MTVRKRGEFYSCQFWVEGKRYCYTFNGKNGQPIIQTKQEAVDEETDLRRAARSGTLIKNSSLKNFKKFFDDVYMDYSKEHKTELSQTFDEYYGSHLVNAFGERGLDQITPRMIERFISTMLQTKTHYNKPFSPVTVRRIYNLLNQIFRMAIRERVLHENPCQYVSRKVLESIPAWIPRERWLNKYEAVEVEDKEGNKTLMTEEERLFAAFNEYGEHLAAIARIMLNTGVRPSELLRVKKSHVNLSDKSKYVKVEKIDVLLQSNSLLIEKGKNGKPRVLPLNESTRDLLKILVSDSTTGEWLFTHHKGKLKGKPIKSVKKGFAMAFERAKIDAARSYDLRHTFATRLVERGVHQYVISALLGHEMRAVGFGSASRITPGYAHVTWDAMVAAVNSLETPKPKVKKLRKTQRGKIVAKGVKLKKAG